MRIVWIYFAMVAALFWTDAVETSPAALPVHVNMGLSTFTSRDGIGYCAAIMMPPDGSTYPTYVSWMNPPLGEFDDKAWRELPTIFPSNMTAQTFVHDHCYPKGKGR